MLVQLACFLCQASCPFLLTATSRLYSAGEVTKTWDVGLKIKETWDTGLQDRMVISSRPSQTGKLKPTV